MSQEQALQIAREVLEPEGFTLVAIRECVPRNGLSGCAVTGLPPKCPAGDEPRMMHAGWAYAAETPPLTVAQVREAAESLVALARG